MVKLVSFIFSATQQASGLTRPVHPRLMILIATSHVSLQVLAIILCYDLILLCIMVILEAPTFDGHRDPWIFTKWLHEMDQLFEQIGLSHERRG